MSALCHKRTFALQQSARGSSSLQGTRVWTRVCRQFPAAFLFAVRGIVTPQAAFNNNPLLQSARKLRSTPGINAVARALLDKHGKRRIVQRSNGFQRYRQSQILAKARRGGAHSGRAYGGGSYQVTHARYRGKLRKDRQMGRATSRRTALSETRDHGTERNCH